ncbi:EamA family transporter RarD [Microbacterium sp. gxy059]|uniref:EamA family transporter RarD n=1 Tax=Microbacterium sp. gxy059 TaxID=2957199 RepID=UPI003D971EF4
MSTAPAPIPDGVAPRTSPSGLAFGFGAYLLWGFLPLFFVALAPSGPWETLAWRVLFSLAVSAVLITAMRLWGRLRQVLRSRRLLLGTVLAGVLIYVNWQTFLVASQTGHVLEASLGYFINPIATVLLAVLVLHEKVRPLQWAAVGVAGAAVVVIVVFYGRVPWLSLILAASFALYGLVKKRMGGDVDAVSGLALETVWLTPVAIAQLAIVAATTGLTMGQHGGIHAMLLVLSGVATAVPLLLFAAATHRVSLTTVGLMQFVAPILQFLVGVFLLGEEMPPERWAGFCMIWVACLLLVLDMSLGARRRRRRRTGVTRS